MNYCYPIFWQIKTFIKRLRNTICFYLFNSSSSLSLWLQAIKMRFSSILWKYLFIFFSVLFKSYMNGNAFPFCSFIIYYTYFYIYYIRCHHKEVNLFFAISIFDRFRHCVIQIACAGNTGISQYDYYTTYIFSMVYFNTRLMDFDP